jgi:RHS repeat-associated protein
VARRDGATGTGGVFYYFSDHLKTASVITDSAGVIKAESDYYPWGGELQLVNNDTNDYKFTGKKRDTETGLDYFGARYYSNGLGRWVSADWSVTPVPVPYADFSDPQSLNQYAYVRNIPTTNVDPDGHDCPVCDLDQEVKELIQSLQHLTPAAAPAVVSAAPAAVLALPSAGAMYLVATQPPMENHPADDPPSAGNMMLDALNPSFQPAPPLPAQTQTQTEEPPPAPAPAPASGGAQKGNGREGKQERLNELGKDPKTSSADRGWIKQDQNAIKNGKRDTVRVPPGKHMAHARGREASKGYSHTTSPSSLQNIQNHRTQHKYDANGTKNKERP